MGPQGIQGERGRASRKGLIGYALLTFGMILGFSGTFWNDHQIQESRAERVEFGNEVRLSLCEEIEALKLQFREDAIRNYERLDVNLRLLKIEKTPAIELAAQSSRDLVLERFASVPCDAERGVTTP